MKPNAYRANEEIRMKAELSRKEAESLIERDLKCPECGYKAGTVFRLHRASDYPMPEMQNGIRAESCLFPQAPPQKV